MKAQGTELKDARIVFFGAGSSAVGVAKSIASVIELKGGVSAEDAKKVRLWDSGFRWDVRSGSVRRSACRQLAASTAHASSGNTPQLQHCRCAPPMEEPSNQLHVSDATSRCGGRVTAASWPAGGVPGRHQGPDHRVARRRQAGAQEGVHAHR